MSSAAPSADRVRVDGKFFRLGAAKFHVKGVAYGPFAPNSRGEMFPEAPQAARDFVQLRELGANVLRVYYNPPRWFLDLAAEHGLKLLVDLPWPKHLRFLDSPGLQRQAREIVRQAAANCLDSPALFAFSVVNEIPPDLVRWSGVRAVEAFVEELVREAKAVDPACLCTFTSFPPTEFLRPANLDFLSFNVYLHQRPSFESYLAHLQTLADDKPLVLAEFGMDSIREGEAHKSEFLSWQIEAAFQGGLAGAVVFSYTDDWFRGGIQIEDWAFGLTDRQREPKQSFRAVQCAFRSAPYFPAPRCPKVSVVVASYNGARTLQACLESLDRLNYPDYEVILVDDGSTDDTQLIAAKFPRVRLIRQENLGLSAARNSGLAAAVGEIIAYTDSDCRADSDWLHYAVNALWRSDFVGIGGHNFLPPDDSPVAAAVMVSPGGPAHVMVTDREAEHIPGCNMLFYRWALEQIGGFDPVFRKAGDDVDVCWRLQQCGYKLGFSPAGFVWHYRRSTIKAYVAQQKGYGEAEALLARQHPEKFNTIGHSIWHGRIYAPAKAGILLRRSIIYHGQFGSGLFQKLYAPAPSFALILCTSLEYHALVTAPLLLLSGLFPALLPLAVASVTVSLTVCAVAAGQAQLSPAKSRWWSRLLVALLFALQPIVRGLARYRTGLNVRSRRLPQTAAPLRTSAPEPREHLAFWSDGRVDRFGLLAGILARLHQDAWPIRSDSGWTDHDLEILGSPWVRLHLVTVTEDLEQGKRSLRCRLDPYWSFQAKTLFWCLLSAELFLIRALAPTHPWIWMLLMTLPILSWCFEAAQAKLLQSLGALLEETAASLKLLATE